MRQGWQSQNNHGIHECTTYWENTINPGNQCGLRVHLAPCVGTESVPWPGCRTICRRVLYPTHRFVEGEVSLETKWQEHERVKNGM